MTDAERQQPPTARAVSFALLDLLLIVVVAAAWTGERVNSRRNEHLSERIDVLRRIARELVVDDPEKCYVISSRRTLYDNHRWEVHLPAGEYQIYMATRGIEANGSPDERKSASIDAGRHKILLTHLATEHGPRFRVFVDERVVFDEQESKDWNTSGSYGGTGDYATQREFPLGELIVLRRVRVVIPQATRPSGFSADDPINGQLLWIEKTADAK
ncbi:MAG: hypothetical protein QGG36_09230 [Pirellulaceae bacterium]|jgi:hypothetical protein|nr:hypothetical protein [Pirellulaceae bacterium]MDP7015969.1 hypothetical protein [Pirellulaceae bacterium]